MHSKMLVVKIFWFLLVMMICVQILLIMVDRAIAQFYFPMTSGALNFYNYGTIRYGTLYGLSGVMPYGLGLGPFGLMNGFWGWNIPGIGGLFGGFYGGISPLTPYGWYY